MMAYTIMIVVGMVVVTCRGSSRKGSVHPDARLTELESRFLDMSARVSDLERVAPKEVRSPPISLQCPF